MCAAAGSRRKSTVVKEIEKIKQKREERRAVQQAIREQFESEYDTSDPNWEFKAMIKYAARLFHGSSCLLTVNPLLEFCSNQLCYAFWK